ncbi:TonB-dependent receptor [Christiangramia fulva]|uniref:TonB-dependent receptor n=1 Tax=Christiangramia fulva TaxID=2126553 RepID=A0A2R3Z584_9FLAO|nr:outer membrane beta-barrel protein [Christiangramia fulva]AVR45443.1 TonB-dependent receptor [Christiangramia fulva]
MMLYQQLIIPILFILFGSACLAQGGQSKPEEKEGSITGVLLDENNETVPFATVAVLKVADSSVVKGTTTDIDGNFEIKAPKTGKFILKITSIGYKPVYTETFSISNPSFYKDFGKINMQTETTMLNEVMVKTTRPQIQVENGIMVMRVEGTAIAAGNTAYDMLSRSPGVTLDQSGNFLINGRSGISVMIDGRQTYLSGDQLKAFLESMPAENIKEIEVVHTPSAKYDAEGTGGVLNIVLKENAQKGMNGSVYAGFEYGKQKFYNAGLNLNYKKGKWNSFLNADFAKRGMYRDQHATRSFPGNENISFYEQNGTQEIVNLVPSVQIGTDYSINKKHSVGFSADLTYRETASDWNTFSELGNPSEEVINIDAKNHYDEEFRNGRFNLHYNGDLDTLGTSLSANLDYVRLQTNTDSRFANDYHYLLENSQVNELLTNDKLSSFDIFSAKVDFRLPFSTTSSLETGLKASKVISDSDLKFYHLEDETFQFDEDISNRFRYTENIYAAYASYDNKINDTWNVKLGLRIEETTGEAKLYNMDGDYKRDYLNFFPNVMVQQKVSENYMLDYSFTRRITRPNYQTLNPAIFYLDPYSYILGNPDLEPQITNSLKLSQTIAKKYHLSLGYDFAKNYMAENPTTDPETGETVYTTENLKSFRSYTASVIAPIEFASFWYANNTFVVNQQNYDLMFEGRQQQNKNLFYMLQSNHQLSLPWDLSLELNGTFRGPLAIGVYTVDSQWWLDAGLKKSFMNERLNVSLKATDIFKTRDMHVEGEYGSNSLTIDQYFFNRALSLNIRYSFSKGSKIKRKSSPEDLEELNRAGG